MNTSGRTALLLVDLQNAFCHPRGSFQQRHGPLVNLPATFAACRALQAAAHERGVLTIFTCLVFSPDYSDAGLLVHALAPAIRSLGGYVRDSWDAAIADDALPPLPAHQLIHKTRYDPFIRTPLHALLEQSGIRHIVIGGVLTDVCVEATARAAFDRDIQITIAEDATTALSAEIKNASLRTMKKHFGRVLPSANPAIWQVPPGNRSAGSRPTGESPSPVHPAIIPLDIESS